MIILMKHVKNFFSYNLFKASKRGRKPLFEKNPDILIYVKDFIEANIEPEAEARRRNSVQYCRGFTSKELRDYIVKRFTEEKSQKLDLSNKTIQRLFNAPNKNYKSASYYKGIFDVEKCGGIIIKTLFRLIAFRYE